jgi:hypothetical protein
VEKLGGMASGFHKTATAVIISDGWTDGQTNGRTDGQTDRQIEFLYSCFCKKGA